MVATIIASSVDTGSPNETAMLVIRLVTSKDTSVETSGKILK
jgi:hypothetical protein